MIFDLVPPRHTGEHSSLPRTSGVFLGLDGRRDWKESMPSMQDSSGQFRNWPVVFNVQGKARFVQEFS